MRGDAPLGSSMERTGRSISSTRYQSVDNKPLGRLVTGSCFISLSIECLWCSVRGLYFHQRVIGPAYSLERS